MANRFRSAEGSLKQAIVGFILTVVTASQVRAEQLDLGALVARLRTAPLVLVGETHHRPESFRLMSAIMDTVAAEHRCLAVSLEVDYWQQPDLDALVAGTGPVEAVYVHPIIDHPAYRTLLTELASRLNTRGCGRMVAADSPLEVPNEDRDAVIAQKTVAAMQNADVVVGLFGLRHVARGLIWRSAERSPVAADQMKAIGVKPFVVLQYWLQPEAPTFAGLYLSCADPAAAALVRKAIAGVNGTYPSDVREVCDALWVWTPRP